MQKVSEMSEAKKQQSRVKSRIAVKKGSTLQNKENVPSDRNKRVIERKLLKPPNGRKTLSEKNNDNSHANPIVKSKPPVKAAPDFGKLHKKWEAKLAKRKAVTKRANTKIEPFDLTKEANTKCDVIDLEDEILELEDDEPVENNVQKSEEIPPVCNCSCGKTERKEETTTTATHEFKVPHSRTTNLSSVKKKEKKVEVEEDLFEFKPDNNALQSILNNDGIRSTPSKRATGVHCSPSPFNQKRTSIYYTGPRPDRPLSAFEKRLSMRRAAAIMSQMAQPKSSFEPSKTLVGVQETGNRFTTTPFRELPNDYNTNPESIPEETNEDETAPYIDPVEHATDSSHDAVENEISWADTLKHYSQAQHQSYSPVQDKEALIAQLEEEVRQTLVQVALDGNINQLRVQYSVPYPSSSNENTTEPRYFPSASTTHTTESINYPSTSKRVTAESSQGSNVSIPLQQRREKPSIYRKLFSSPSSSHSQNRQAIVAPNASNPRYLHFSDSSTLYARSFPIVSADQVEQEYNTKSAASFRVPEPGGLCRAPNSSPLCSLPEERRNEYTSEEYGIPLANEVPFSPLVNRHTERSLIKEHGFQSSSKTSAFNSGVRVMPVRSTPSRFENASGRHWFGESATQKKEHTQHINLVSTASASVNSKLKREVFETESAFRRLQPSRTGITKHASSSFTSSCTPVSEQNVLVPTPLRPVVAGNDVIHGTAPSDFISRHRQIMREALVKSRDHAEEILLDAEVSLYARNIICSRIYDSDPRLVNPLAKLFNEGDDRHFVPVT